MLVPERQARVPEKKNDMLFEDQNFFGEKRHEAIFRRCILTELFRDKCIGVETILTLKLVLTLTLVLVRRRSLKLHGSNFPKKARGLNAHRTFCDYRTCIGPKSIPNPSPYPNPSLNLTLALALTLTLVRGLSRNMHRSIFPKKARGLNEYRTFGETELVSELTLALTLALNLTLTLALTQTLTLSLVLAQTPTLALTLTQLGD